MKKKEVGYFKKEKKRMKREKERAFFFIKQSVDISLLRN
jgi:hypothetical protein